MNTLLSLALAAVMSGSAPEQSLPNSPEGYYALGQEFANCSAHQALTAFVAGRAGSPDATTLAEGRARGWKFAGMVFLAEGLDPSRRSQTERTFDSLVQVKLNELKSRYDVDADAPKEAIPKEYARECAPLVPMQEMVIEMMGRTG